MSPKTLGATATEGAAGRQAQKADTLRSLFRLFEGGSEVAVTAYGNAETDVRAYLEAGIPNNRIYFVNEESVVRHAKWY